MSEVEKLFEDKEQFSKEVQTIQAELEVEIDPAKRQTKQAELAQAKENLSLAIAKIIKLSRDAEAEKEQAKMDQYTAGKKKAFTYVARLKNTDTKLFSLLEQIFNTVEKHLELSAEQSEAARSANVIARDDPELPLIGEGPPVILGSQWQGAGGVPAAVGAAVQSYGAHWSEFENRRRRGVALKQDKPVEDQVKATGYPMFDDEGAVSNAP